MLYEISWSARIWTARSLPAARSASNDAATASLWAARLRVDQALCEIEERSLRMRHDTEMSGTTSKARACANAAALTGWSS